MDGQICARTSVACIALTGIQLSQDTSVGKDPYGGTAQSGLDIR